MLHVGWHSTTAVQWYRKPLVAGSNPVASLNRELLGVPYFFLLRENHLHESVVQIGKKSGGNVVIARAGDKEDGYDDS